jgi:RimJ/RimL family protein N-acetyltransferase
MTMMRELYDVLVRCDMSPPPFEEWSAYYSENAELWPIAKDGKFVGGVLFKGHTVHIAVHPDWQGRWLTAAMLRGYRAWTHDCEIFATPALNNAAACRLAERLGLERRGQTDCGRYAIYIKAPNPLKEEVPCPH